MSDLDSQVEWLVAFGMADGSQRALLVNAVGSGSNDARPQLLALFPNQSSTIKIKRTENGTEKLWADVTGMVYWLCARRYGQRRAKRKTEAIVCELEAKGEMEGQSDAAGGAPCH